jgi:hypothetical protein
MNMSGEWLHRDPIVRILQFILITSWPLLPKNGKKSMGWGRYFLGKKLPLSICQTDMAVQWQYAPSPGESCAILKLGRNPV